LHTFSIALPQPYDFLRTFGAAAAYYAPGVTLVEDGIARYRRLLRVGDALALVELEGAHEGEDGAHMLVRVLAARGDVDMQVLRAEVTHMVYPAHDLTPFYFMAEENPYMRETVMVMWGLRLLRCTSVFEALMVTIIEQQISLKSAQRAERWLAATYGDRLTWRGEEYHTLPSAAQVALLDVEALTPLKITFIRMNRLLDIARAQASGALELEALRDAAPDTLYSRLLALKGVGHWTAAWTMTRAQGTFVYLGGADVALRAAVNHYFFGQTGRAHIPDMDAAFSTFGEFAGLACYYLILRWAFEKSAF
jgi:DNA-3-methyladenine glycosylase II